MAETNTNALVGEEPDRIAPRQFVFSEISLKNCGEDVLISIGMGTVTDPDPWNSFNGTIDKIIEISVGGKVIASIDANILTPKQLEGLREVFSHAFIPAWIGRS